MNKLRNVQKNILVYSLPLIILVINLGIFNKFFMPIEGWWVTFGYLINQGLEPYKDFSSAIVPLFMCFNAFLLNIFGDSFLNFRILGIFTVLLTYLLLQWLLSRITDKIVASLAVFSAFTLNMSTPVYLAYDYTSFIDFLIILILIIYYNLYNSEKIYKNILYSFFLGVLISIMILVKQNIGIFFGFAVLLSSLIYVKRYRIFSCFSFSLGFILFFFEFNKLMQLTKIFDELILKNDAKGSVTTVLFRFITDDYNAKILFFAIVLNVIYIFVNTYKIKILYVLTSSKFYNKYSIQHKANLIIKLIQGIILLFSIAIIVHFEPLYSYFFIIIKIITIAILINIVYDLFARKNNVLLYNYQYFILILLGLVYTTTHSAGYNFIGLYFVVAFMFSYALFKVREFKLINYWYIVIVIVMLSIGLSKFFQPYNWWGLTQDSIFNAKFTTQYKQLEGIKVDKKTKDLFDIVKNNVDKYSTERKDTLFYPDLPIFYFLHQKLPPGKLLIQWFDFATTSQLKSDLTSLSENLPKVLVILEPPLFVYEGHYKLLKHNLEQMQYDTFFNKLLLNGKYNLVELKYFINLDDINPFQKIRRKIVVTNREFINIKLKDLSFMKSEIINDADYRIHQIIKNGYNMQIDTIDYSDYQNLVIEQGTILDLEMSAYLFNQIVSKIGYVLNENEHYVLKILVRNDK